jgi:hypothetical protein
MSIESVATVTPAGELHQRSATVTLLRRPLLLAFVLGCGVSLLASGRMTPRLIVDGTLSFAFVPLCELIAYAIVYRLQRGARPFAQTADRYFAGNAPWLWWMLALMTATAILPARRLGSLLAPILFTAPIPIALSVRFDWRFFRGDGRSSRQALIDIILQRSIAWSLATAYFLGVALTTRDFFYTFVEMGQEIRAWAGTML